MQWTSHHEALLTALRSQEIVPSLILRLSGERITPSDADSRRLRDLPAALLSSPAWSVLESLLERPDAWPACWETARQLGFTPRADHHLALLLMDFSHELRAQHDYQLSLWCLRESLSSWSNLSKTEYLKELGKSVVPNGDPKDLAKTIEGLLTADLKLVSDWTDAAYRAQPIDPKFARAALSHLRVFADLSGDSDLVRTTKKSATLAIDALNTLPANQLRAAIQEVDFANGQLDGLVLAYQQAVHLLELLDYPGTAVADIIHQAVDTCWTLRRIDRDDLPAFAEIVKACAPSNDLLFEKIMKNEVFGHNARCADFYVFRAEPELGQVRRMYLDLGLQVCPGHRNSAMLISYMLIHDADILHDQLALLPTILGKSSHPLKVLRQIQAKLDEASSFHSHGERLEKCRERFEQEVLRFGINEEELR